MKRGTHTDLCFIDRHLTCIEHSEAALLDDTFRKRNRDEYMCWREIWRNPQSIEWFAISIILLAAYFKTSYCYVCCFLFANRRLRRSQLIDYVLNSFVFHVCFRCTFYGIPSLDLAPKRCFAAMFFCCCFDRIIFVGNCWSEWNCGAYAKRKQTKNKRRKSIESQRQKIAKKN